MGETTSSMILHISRIVKYYFKLQRKPDYFISFQIAISIHDWPTKKEVKKAKRPFQPLIYWQSNSTTGHTHQPNNPLILTLKRAKFHSISQISDLWIRYFPSSTKQSLCLWTHHLLSRASNLAFFFGWIIFQSELQRSSTSGFREFTDGQFVFFSGSQLIDVSQG